MQSRAIRNQGCCCHPPSLPVPRGGVGLKTPSISQGFVPNQWYSHSPTSLAGISRVSVTFLVLLWTRKLAPCTLGRTRALLAIVFRGIWVTASTWGHAEGPCAGQGGTMVLFTCGWLMTSPCSLGCSSTSLQSCCCQREHPLQGFLV